MIWVIASRAVERLLVVLVGALAVWLGFRLFMSLPQRREGEGKLDLPGGVSVYVSRIGPGVFFALFGTGLIAYAATQPVSYRDDRGLLASEPAALAANAEGAPGARAYSGMTAGLAQTSGVSRPLGMDPAEVIRGLNLALDHAETLTPNSRRLDAAAALRQAKLAVMREVWDSGAWGAYEPFHRWVTEGFEAGPAPTGATAAAVFYRQRTD
jgi:hypothetical protein